MLASLMFAGLAACTPDSNEQADAKQAFPQPDRPISELAGNEFSTEIKRDKRGEAQKVMELAAIEPGMTVADIGAGEGYYTVRLANAVGSGGRVLAQDIDREVLERLGNRVEKDRLNNVSIKLGAPDDPRLPEKSFDRVFLVHMYHEVEDPFAFLWHLWPSLREGGQVVVVDVDRQSDQHGIPPTLLVCEFRQSGFEMVAFQKDEAVTGYYAQFQAVATRPEPQEIKPCNDSMSKTDGDQ